MRGTPITHLLDTLNIEPIRDFIHQLKVKFFAVNPILVPWSNKSEITLWPT
jgi:hypothetical protein